MLQVKRWKLSAELSLTMDLIHALSHWTRNVWKWFRRLACRNPSKFTSLAVFLTPSILKELFFNVAPWTSSRIWYFFYAFLNRSKVFLWKLVEIWVLRRVDSFTDAKSLQKTFFLIFFYLSNIFSCVVKLFFLARRPQLPSFHLRCYWKREIPHDCWRSQRRQCRNFATIFGCNFQQLTEPDGKMRILSGWKERFSNSYAVGSTRCKRPISAFFVIDCWSRYRVKKSKKFLWELWKKIFRKLLKDSVRNEKIGVGTKKIALTRFLGLRFQQQHGFGGVCFVHGNLQR